MIAAESLDAIFAEKVSRIFGADDDPIVLVEHRAKHLLAEHRPIVWEGDAQTFGALRCRVRRSADNSVAAPRRAC